MAGTGFNDRVLAGQVRSLALTKIKAILEGEEKVDKQFYNQLILRLASGVLPRLNEHTGMDGQALVMKFDSIYDRPKNISETTPETAGNSSA